MPLCGNRVLLCETSSIGDRECLEQKPLIVVCYHLVYHFVYIGSDHVNNSFDFPGKASFGLALGCTGKARF